MKRIVNKKIIKMREYIKNLFSKTPSVVKKGTVETLCMVLVPLMVLLAMMSCDKVRNIKWEEIDTSPTSLTHYSLIGTWHDVPNYHEMYTFLKDTIYMYLKNHPYYGDSDTLVLTYKFISVDSIQVERLALTIPEERTTKNKIVFYGNDTLLIEGFTPSIGISQLKFYDVKLVKIK